VQSNDGISAGPVRSKTLSFLLSLLCVTLMAAGQTPAPPPPGEEALLEDLPVVEAASLHVQSLEEAPANVTIISKADIQKYGYRTLAEALDSVRGFDLTYDRIYHYAGVHGFSLPGDFNTRFLVMLNGHALTENVYDSNNFFGEDFGLDMDLVQRIEVVRGPSSALYGSNGMFATINVVTRSPVDHTKLRFSTETDSFGEKKAQVSTSQYLGHGANLLVSASVFNNSGQTLFFPEYDFPQTFNGVARGVDGERGYHTFANLIWRGWDFVAYFNSREKQPPIAFDAASIFGIPGNRVRDARNFVRLLHSSDIGSTGKIRWQVTYDQYRYDDRFDSETAEGMEDVRNIARGDWVGSQFEYSFSVPKLGRLTVGAQATWNIRNLQQNYVASPAFVQQLNVNYPYPEFGLLAQQEVNLSARWKAYLGLRYDDYNGRAANNSVSPRLALVYQRSPKEVYKFVYGRPFRNPSAFEQYYTGASNLPSGPLRPETAHTFEISMERQLKGSFSAIVNVYDYRTHGLITAAYIAAGLQQFQNADNAESKGIEFEMSGKPWGRLETSASLALQRAVDSLTGNRLPNSPRQVGKLRVAWPVLRNRLILSSSARYLGSRDTLADDSVGPVILADATATTNHLLGQFDLQAGIRNLFDRVYYDPIALVLDRMRGDGRSAFVKLIWRSKE
jgi:outer membrane receptor for ferrienterochelin and colicins